MWRRIEGQERICATDTCSREPAWCLDVDDIASVYCDRCKLQIDGNRHCRDVFEENVKYGGMP